MAEYTSDQLFEIEEGKKASIDTSIYENPDFLAIQMRQIRFALMEGVDVAPYVRPEFDWMQMEEIFEGLEQQVDVSIYADPALPYEKMHQIRKGLLKGIDISADTQYSAGVLKQIRKSKEEELDIYKYVEQHYDPEQLYQIRLALKAGLDLDPYIENDFRGAAIAEIRIGLEEDVDVTTYADIKFGWRQMREIRLGLEKRLDISKYANPYYDWEQMREIRLGLEDGLDVTPYATLMYTSSEMRKRRIRLQEVSKEVSFSDGDYEISVTSGGIEAYIKVRLKEGRIKRDSLMETLQAHDITQGYQEENIDRICEGQYDDKPILVARGAIPKKGADGRYEYFFDADSGKGPKIREDGSVDYQYVNWGTVVNEGDVLAVYHDAEEGEDGFSVNGVVLKGKKGIEQGLLKGSGFVLSEDKHTYTAAISGMVSLKGGILQVIKHLDVSEVSLVTGNVDFDGTVHVKGDVENGALIKATEDIIIDGNVGGAEIISTGGRVILNKGMNAGRRGKVSAKGGVVSKFLEGVICICEGDIQVTTSINSLLRTKGKILSDKVIIGGKAFASHGYKVTHLGNAAGTATQIQIGIDQEIIDKVQELIDRQKENQKQLMLLENSMKELKLKYPPEIRNEMPVFKKIDKAMFTINQQQIELAKQKEDYNRKILYSRECTIRIEGQAFEGVTCILHKARWEARGERYVELKSDGAVVTVKNL